MMRQRGKFAAFAGAILLASTSIPSVAFADSAAELQLLREQLAVMQQRLEQLEAQQTQTAEKVEATVEKVEDTRERAVLSSGKGPGSFIIPGTDTEFSVGGYAKLDLIYDLNEAGGDAFDPGGFSTSGDGDEERFRAHARQSRVAIKTSTPTDYGALKTHIEGDFFGSGGNEVFSNSNSFRLRHAYGQIGGFLAGQFWTNFMPIESYPSTVDFNGPAGIPFIRQAQIRYTHPINDNLKVSVSLENSEFSGRTAFGSFSESTNSNFGIQAGLDELPDITAAVTYSDDWGLVKLAGVGRYLSGPDSVDANGVDVPGGLIESDDSEFGWGVNLSGNVNAWPGGKLLGSFTYGDGVGRYILNGFSQDGFVDANGNLETIEAYGVTVQATQQITPKVKAALAYGRYEALDTFGPGDVESLDTVHASLFWKPVDRLTVGGEVIWGQRQDESGADDDGIRLQTSVQVNF